METWRGSLEFIFSEKSSKKCDHSEMNGSVVLSPLLGAPEYNANDIRGECSVQ